jgi:hypothetical protein
MIPQLVVVADDTVQAGPTLRIWWPGARREMEALHRPELARLLGIGIRSSRL